MRPGIFAKSIAFFRPFRYNGSRFSTQRSHELDATVSAWGRLRRYDRLERRSLRLLDGLKDGLLSIPILFLAYLLMELLERSSRLNEGLLRRYSRRAGPALGGLLGIVPQCGISGAAATLFSTGSITVGTMLAVFFATSGRDAAHPSLLPDGEQRHLVEDHRSHHAFEGCARHPARLSGGSAVRPLVPRAEKHPQLLRTRALRL